MVTRRDFFALVVNLGAQTVDEILVKYYDALGGLDKLKSVNTIIQEGVFATPMGNAELQVSIKKKRPNKWISEMSFQGQKSFRPTMAMSPGCKIQ